MDTQPYTVAIGLLIFLIFIFNLVILLNQHNIMQSIKHINIVNMHLNNNNHPLLCFPDYDLDDDYKEYMPPKET